MCPLPKGLMSRVLLRLLRKVLDFIQMLTKLILLNIRSESVVY